MDSLKTEMGRSVSSGRKEPGAEEVAGHSFLKARQEAGNAFAALLPDPPVDTQPVQNSEVIDTV